MNQEYLKIKLCNGDKEVDLPIVNVIDWMMHERMTGLLTGEAYLTLTLDNNRSRLEFDISPKYSRMILELLKGKVDKYSKYFATLGFTPQDLREVADYMEGKK